MLPLHLQRILSNASMSDVVQDNALTHEPRQKLCTAKRQLSHTQTTKSKPRSSRRSRLKSIEQPTHSRLGKPMGCRWGSTPNKPASPLKDCAPVHLSRRVETPALALPVRMLKRDVPPVYRRQQTRHQSKIPITALLREVLSADDLDIDLSTNFLPHPAPSLGRVASI